MRVILTAIWVHQNWNNCCIFIIQHNEDITKLLMRSTRPTSLQYSIARVSIVYVSLHSVWSFNDELRSAASSSGINWKCCDSGNNIVRRILINISPIRLSFGFYGRFDAPCSAVCDACWTRWGACLLLVHSSIVHFLKREHVYAHIIAARSKWKWNFSLIVFLYNAYFTN